MNLFNRTSEILTRKRIGTVLAVCLLVFSATGVMPESPEVELYKMLYANSTTIEERRAILAGAAELEDPDTGELFADALSDILRENKSLRTATERSLADESIRLIASRLSRYKYLPAADNLWKVTENFDQPLVKSEAIVALGQMRAVKYFENIRLLLKNLNLKPTAEPESGEKLAFGCVLALQKYADPTAYSEVFYASVGWYSRRIRELADIALPAIADDPTPSLIEIVKSGDLAIKQIAIDKGAASKAAFEKKAELASIVLSEGFDLATNDVKEKVALSQLRKKAIGILISVKDKSGAPVADLQRSMEYGIDMEEQLIAIQALGVNGTDGATKALGGMLLKLNQRRKDGLIGETEERLVRAVIPALGATGNTLAKPSLQQVPFVGWTNAVTVLAKDALDKLK